MDVAERENCLLCKYRFFIPQQSGSLPSRIKLKGVNVKRGQENRPNSQTGLEWVKCLAPSTLFPAGNAAFHELGICSLDGGSSASLSVCLSVATCSNSREQHLLQALLLA